MVDRDRDPMNPALHWTLFAAEAEARIDLPLWTAQARSLVRAQLALVEVITDPGGRLPREATVTFLIRHESDTLKASGVRVHTLPLTDLPRASEVASDAVRAIGGAGMDFLVARAQRVWMVETGHSRDVRAPLAVAAVLAGVLLAPIVPPEGGVIFGLKTARTKLETQGWKT